jgi:outer membrane protein assembly factor BamD
MSKITRSAAALIACALVLPAAGCAGNKNAADTAYVARDVNTLYDLAKRRMDGPV